MPWLTLLSDIKEKIRDMDKACSFHKKKGSLRWVRFFSLVEFLYDFRLVFWDYKCRDSEKGREEDEGSLGHGSGRLMHWQSCRFIWTKVAKLEFGNFIL